MASIVLLCNCQPSSCLGRSIKEVKGGRTAIRSVHWLRLAASSSYPTVQYHHQNTSVQRSAADSPTQRFPPAPGKETSKAFPCSWASLSLLVASRGNGLVRLMLFWVSFRYNHSLTHEGSQPSARRPQIQASSPWRSCYTSRLSLAVSISARSIAYRRGLCLSDSLSIAVFGWWDFSWCHITSALTLDRYHHNI